jgi:hypothetical protein
MKGVRARHYESVILWLLANKHYWIDLGVPQIVECQKALKKAGLYSKNTYYRDINVRKFVQEDPRCQKFIRL